MRRLWKVLLSPAKAVASVFHPNESKERRLTECCIGLVICCGAVAVADSYPAHCMIPKYVWEAVAYIVHSFGAAPIIALALEQ